MPKPPPWDVQLRAAAQRDLNRLPPKVAAAIVEFLTVTLPANPQRQSKELTHDLAGLRSARRGDYRILFELIEQKIEQKTDDDRVDDLTDVDRPVRRILLVTRIDHRAHVYRRL